METAARKQRIAAALSKSAAPSSIFDSFDFDFTHTAFEDAIDAAHGLLDPVHQAGALVKISRRRNLNQKQRAKAAVEALNAGAKLNSSDPNRLFIFAMLGRDFTRRGDRLHAARAASLLAESLAASTRSEPGTHPSEPATDGQTASLEKRTLRRLLGDARKRGYTAG